MAFKLTADVASDKQTGISIRFIRQFDIGRATRIDMLDPETAALVLAMRDTRDVPSAVKIADARAFIRETYES